MIKGKVSTSVPSIKDYLLIQSFGLQTPEEIRKLFNIQNDFTPEEEEQIRKENVRPVP